MGIRVGYSVVQEAIDVAYKNGDEISYLKENFE